MSKSNVCGMSLLMSSIIALCTLLNLNVIKIAFSSVSGLGLFESTVARLRDFVPELIMYFVFAILFIIFIKLINTAWCNRTVNTFTALLDIIVFILCTMIFIINISFFSWLALTASILSFIFNAVFSRAQM